MALVRSRGIRYGQLNPEDSQMALRRISHLHLFEKRGDQWLIVSHLIAQEMDRD